MVSDDGSLDRFAGRQDLPVVQIKPKTAITKTNRGRSVVIFIFLDSIRISQRLDRVGEGFNSVASHPPPRAVMSRAKATKRWPVNSLKFGQRAALQASAGFSIRPRPEKRKALANANPRLSRTNRNLKSGQLRTRRYLRGAKGRWQSAQQ
jgi:hypothetical protein